MSLDEIRGEHDEMSRSEYEATGTLRRAGFCFSNNPTFPIHVFKQSLTELRLFTAILYAYRTTGINFRNTSLPQQHNKRWCFN